MSKNHEIVKKSRKYHQIQKMAQHHENGKKVPKMQTNRENGKKSRNCQKNREIVKKSRKFQKIRKKISNIPTNPENGKNPENAFGICWYFRDIFVIFGIFTIFWHFRDFLAFSRFFGIFAIFLTISRFFGIFAIFLTISRFFGKSKKCVFQKVTGGTDDDSVSRSVIPCPVLSSIIEISFPSRSWIRAFPTFSIFYRLDRQMFDRRTQIVQISIVFASQIWQWATLHHNRVRN